MTPGLASFPLSSLSLSQLFPSLGRRESILAGLLRGLTPEEGGEESGCYGCPAVPGQLERSVGYSGRSREAPRRRRTPAGNPALRKAKQHRWIREHCAHPRGRAGPEAPGGLSRAAAWEPLFCSGGTEARCHSRMGLPRPKCKRTMSQESRSPSEPRPSTPSRADLAASPSPSHPGPPGRASWCSPPWLSRPCSHPSRPALTAWPWEALRMDGLA